MNKLYFTKMEIIYDSTQFKMHLSHTLNDYLKCNLHLFITKFLKNSAEIIIV